MRRFVNRADVEDQGRVGAFVERDHDGLRARQLDSFWLYVDENDEGYTPHALKDGFWEAWITLWMDRNVAEKSRVIDIGANHGYYSFFLAAKGCEVTAVEPQPHLAHLLRKSRSVNNVDVAVMQEAISDSNGTIQMMVPVGHGMNATISNQFSYAPNGYGTIEVETSKLDDWFPNGGVDFIKVDAEGAEDLIWAGSNHFRSVTNPNAVWLMEWRYDRYKEPGKFAEDIFEDYLVYSVNYDGSETPIVAPHHLYERKHEDWMLVLRPKILTGTMDQRG